MMSTLRRWGVLPLIFGVMGVDAELRAAERDRSGPAEELRAALPDGGRVWVVDNRAPNADDAGPGDAQTPFLRIQAAAERAEPGDAVLVFGGVYRERVSPARGGTAERPIRYVAAAGERVVVKGSEPWTPAWRRIDEAKNIFEGGLDPATFEGIPNPYRVGISIAGSDENPVARPVAADAAVWPRTLGQVFVDGEEYEEAESPAELAAAPGRWLADAGGEKLRVHFAPAGANADPSRVDAGPEARAVEIGVRNRLFAPRRRGLGHLHVRGFVFEHCANQGPFPQAGAVSFRSGHDWRFENNVVRRAKTLGLDCGSEYWDGKQIADTDEDQQRLMIGGRHWIAGNEFSDNGLCGVAGWNHAKTVIRRNVVERNNRLGFVAGLDAKWWEQSGIKMHGFTDGVIEENLVRDNDAFGIWLDNGYNRARIRRNLVLNNQLAGIFIELGDHPVTVDNNIVAYTRGGDGIYCHDASGVTVANNLLYYNANFGVWMHVVTERKTGGKLVETSDERLAHNLFVGNHAGAVCLPPASARARNNASDYNAFIDGAWMMGTSESRFRLNSNSGRIDLGMDLDTDREAEGAAPSNPESLDLASWRRVMKMDLHSAALRLKGKNMLRTRRLHLEIGLEEVPAAPADTGVAGVTRDWFGQPVGGEKPIVPGPFQNLRAGPNAFLLWPFTGPAE